MKKLFLLLLLVPTFLLAKTQTVVYDVTNNRVIKGLSSNDEVSIASLSKLMTVYTVLKANQDLDEKLTVQNKKTPTTKLVTLISMRSENQFLGAYSSK